MGAAAMFLILLLVAPVVAATSPQQFPDKVHLSSVEDLRAKFRQLWTEVVTGSPNKTVLCLPGIKTITHDIFALNATRGELDSLAFYSTHSSDNAVGMRASFIFPHHITRRIMARMLAIVDLRPTGHWRLFNLCPCEAKKVSTIPAQLQAYVHYISMRSKLCANSSLGYFRIKRGVILCVCKFFFSFFLYLFFWKLVPKLSL